LTSFPQSVCTLAQLEVLDLSYNKIAHIPAELARLAHLRELNLSFNAIAKMERIENSLLVKLNLSNNLLTDVPSGVAELHELHHLDLSYNVIASLENFSGVSELEWLSFAGNRIERVDFALLAHLDALKYLNVASNKSLARIDNADTAMPALSMLVLSSTAIEAVPQFNAPQLKTIRIPNTPAAQAGKSLSIVEEHFKPPNLEETQKNHIAKLKGKDESISKEKICAVSEIIDGLFLTSVYGAADPEMLIKHNITHILTVAGDVEPYYPHVTSACAAFVLLR
jgi:Leucine-rich repeat (LRR) protein